MSSFAHNSGYGDYYELRRAVWDSNEPLVVKALALAILEHMRPDKLDAYPSRSRLARMCSISENTLERHWGAINQWIDVIRERGRRNVYRARIYACASELIRAIPERPQAIGGAFADQPPKNNPPKRVLLTATTTQNHVQTTPQNDRTEDLREELSNNPPIPPENERDEEQGLSWIGDQLVAANGHAPVLEKLLDGKLALSEALGRIAPTLDRSLNGYALDMQVAAAVQRVAIETRKAAEKRKREPKEVATRLAANFLVPDDWRQWVHKAHGLQDSQIEYLATGFVRYWTGPDAKNPMKKDWYRTWQNNVDARVARGEIPHASAKRQQPLSFEAQDRAKSDEITEWLKTGMQR